MKRLYLSCNSPASTAVCSSLDHRSMVRNGTRPVHRQHYSKPSYVPCSSTHLPITPKASNYEKSRKGSDHMHRKTSASSSSSVKPTDFRRKSTAGVGDLRSPSSSSRHLLSDNPYIDWISESDQHFSALVPSQANQKISFNVQPSSLAWVPESSSALVPSQTLQKSRHLSSKDHSLALRSSSSAHSRHQVVVLRVSIHCKGCEGKVRKHISKMEGVTSFSIDVATKKVTIIGNVTPLAALASVSKVKNAQLWTSPSSYPAWST